MSKIPERLKAQGVTQEDWDDVCDNPPITIRQLMKAQRFVDVFPELAATIQPTRRKGPTQAVTLRVRPETVALFRLKGKNWRKQMVSALEKAALELASPGNPHPGKVLRELFLAPRNLTLSDFAAATHIPERTLEALLKEEAPITAGLSIRLASYFEITPGFWLRLQKAYNEANSARHATPELRSGQRRP